MVHAKVAFVEVTTEVDNAVGFGHVGAGAHVTFAVHPAAVTLPSDVNTKVKHPPGTEEVTSPGETVPWNMPNNGALESLPSYILR